MTGVVTQTDVYRAMTHGQEFHERIGIIANREVATLHQGQPVQEALRVLYLKDVKQAPVLDTQFRPIGILSHLDIAAARVRLEQTRPNDKNASQERQVSQRHQ
jgi:CBS domain-containing protein